MFRDPETRAANSEARTNGTTAVTANLTNIEDAGEAEEEVNTKHPMTLEKRAGFKI